MDIQLERATGDDAQTLLEMQKICFASHLQRYQDYETSPAMMRFERLKWQIEHENYYKIVSDGLCVGAINIRALDVPGGYKLHVIYILPDFQGKHIGQTAIKLAEALFPDANSWCLETLADMPSNRHVYEKMGYQFTGETETLNDKLTLVFYRKEL